MDIEGTSVFALGDGQWNIPAFNTLLQEVMRGSSQVENFTIEADFAKIGHRRFIVNARKMRLHESTTESLITSSEAEFILLAMYDAP